jgi:hypothetical protein
MVKIKPGFKPIYTDVADTNANKSKKFYVRSGNSSQEIGLNEVSEYVSKRFK